MYCCTTGNDGKTKQECTNRAGYGSLAGAMICFFSGYSNCSAVPQEPMGKPRRNVQTGLGTAFLLVQCYVSLQGTSVLYCCTSENDGKTKQECTNRAGYGSLAGAMFRFFSGYSS